MGYRFRTLAAALTLSAAAAASPAAASADSLFGQHPPASTGAVPSGPVVVPNRPGPEVSGKVAVLIRGVAYAPSRAPLAVKMTIWSANKIRHKPYKWGGGHRSWKDSGYDCSGSVSYALHGAGILAYPLASGGFMHWGARGAGKWISVYASKTHAFMIVAGLRFDTSGAGASGPRWRPEPRWERHFKVRHPAGL
ncbi:MAG: hypothetical protein QOD53_2321 [Thermoleophilaceae bacterium]|nr:hypothetical protein [Thermoleophilaceae bacterium]